jgi:hypothetical protein
MKEILLKDFLMVKVDWWTKTNNTSTKDSSKKEKNMEEALKKPKHKNIKVIRYYNSCEFKYGLRYGLGKLEVFKD